MKQDQHASTDPAAGKMRNSCDVLCFYVLYITFINIKISQITSNHLALW